MTSAERGVTGCGAYSHIDVHARARDGHNRVTHLNASQQVRGAMKLAQHFRTIRRIFSGLIF